MKFKLTCFCLFFPFFCFAQSGPIRVVLQSDSIIYTRYADLNNNPSFRQPFVRIDERNGRRIAIDQIKYIDGTDQNNVYKYFTPVTYLGSQIFAERTFKSDRISLFHTNIISGTWNATYAYRYLNYSKDNQPIKKATYANLKADLADNPAAWAYLKKGNGNRVAQLVLYGLGAGLLVSSIATFANTDVETPANPPALPSGDRSSSIKIPPGLIAGAVCLYIPWFLNNPKQDHFTKALESYK